MLLTLGPLIGAIGEGLFESADRSRGGGIHAAANGNRVALHDPFLDRQGQALAQLFCCLGGAQSSHLGVVGELPVSLGFTNALG